MATKKTQRKVNKGKLLGCFLILACFIMGALFVSQVYRIYQRSLDLKAAQTRLAELEAECELVMEELELLNDENYITRYARKNWIFTKEGETVIPLPDDAISSNNE